MAVNSLKSNANPQKSLSVQDNYTRSAIRRTGMTKSREVQQLRSSKLKLTPPKIGNYASSIRIDSQENKTIQDRFLDIFA